MRKQFVLLSLLGVLTACDFGDGNYVSISSTIQAPAYYAETYADTFVPVEGMPYEETVVQVENIEGEQEETIVQQAPVVVEKLPLMKPEGEEKEPVAGEITVVAKDTVYSLSRKHRVPVRAIISLNSLEPPYILSIGQKLKMPGSPHYVVQKGDTIYSLARRFNVNMATLASTNDIKPPYTISIGQTLLLPGSIVQPEEQVSKKEAEKAIKKAEPPARKAPQTSAKKQASKKQPTVAAKKTSAPAAKVVRRKTTAVGAAPDFFWPVNGKMISKFGTAGKGRHNDGIDIAAAKGTPVKAAASGSIVYAGKELEGFGKLILMKHQNGWISAYAHLDEITAEKGKWLAKGASIGTVGTTGTVFSPQLHFEIRQGSKAIDPLKHLKK